MSESTYSIPKTPVKAIGSTCPECGHWLTVHEGRIYCDYVYPRNLWGKVGKFGRVMRGYDDELLSAMARRKTKKEVADSLRAIVYVPEDGRCGFEERADGTGNADDYYEPKNADGYGAFNPNAVTEKQRLEWALILMRKIEMSAFCEPFIDDDGKWTGWTYKGKFLTGKERDALRLLYYRFSDADWHDKVIAARAAYE